MAQGARNSNHFHSPGLSVNALLSGSGKGFDDAGYFNSILSD